MEFGSQATQGHLHFGEPSYWEVRYESEFAKLTSKFDTFDFYCPFDLVYPFIDSIVDMQAAQRILIVGVGRSGIVEFLYKKGFREIVAIDISETVVAKMAQKYIDYHGVQFLCVDVLEMAPFADNSFTLVIDKGCLDAVMCGTEFRQMSKSMFEEVHRVLDKEGIFLSVSHAPAITRVPYLRQVRWAVDSMKLPEGESLTLYIGINTDKEELLNKKVVGGEAALPQTSSKVVSKLDAGAMNKNSTTRKPGGGGMLSVTSDVSYIENLVKESLDVDGD